MSKRRIVVETNDNGEWPAEVKNVLASALADAVRESRDGHLRLSMKYLIVVDTLKELSEEGPLKREKLVERFTDEIDLSIYRAGRWNRGDSRALASRLVSGLVASVPEETE